MVLLWLLHPQAHIRLLVHCTSLILSNLLFYSGPHRRLQLYMSQRIWRKAVLFYMLTEYMSKRWKMCNGIRGSFCTCKEGFTGASCEKVLPTSPPNNSNTGESSSHSSNRPSSHSSNHPSSHPSNHLSSTRESTTNASTAEPTTAFPSKNGTGENMSMLMHLSE